jgi:hypothetical protein
VGNTSLWNSRSLQDQQADAPGQVAPQFGDARPDPIGICYDGNHQVVFRPQRHAGLEGLDLTGDKQDLPPEESWAVTQPKF